MVPRSRIGEWINTKQEAVSFQSKLAGVSLINDYKKMKKLKGSGKSIIAFARKLSRIIYVMLKSKTRFDATKLMRGVYDAAS